MIKNDWLNKGKTLLWQGRVCFKNLENTKQKREVSAQRGKIESSENGQEIALNLTAGRGARVILACRNVPKPQEVADARNTEELLEKELDL